MCHLDFMATSSGSVRISVMLDNLSFASSSVVLTSGNAFTAKQLFCLDIIGQ